MTKEEKIKDFEASTQTIFADLSEGGNQRQEHNLLFELVSLIEYARQKELLTEAEIRQRVIGALDAAIGIQLGIKELIENGDL